MPFNLFRKVVQAITDDKFHDVFRDYDEYHEQVHTGDLLRASKVEDWIEEGSKVLDAGCGDGVVAEYLASKRKLEIEGIDVTGKARKRGLKVTVQDLDREFNPAKGYDYVLFMEVLEHLQFPHVVLKKAARRARKGVIVTIPNTAWLPWRVQLLLGKFPRQTFTHLHYWSFKDFPMFCNQLGLQVVKARGFAMTKKYPWMEWLAAAWPNLFASQSVYLVKAGGKRL